MIPLCLIYVYSTISLGFSGLAFGITVADICPVEKKQKLFTLAVLILNVLLNVSAMLTFRWRKRVKPNVIFLIAFVGCPTFPRSVFLHDHVVSLLLHQCAGNLQKYIEGLGIFAFLVFSFGSLFLSNLRILWIPSWIAKNRLFPRVVWKVLDKHKKTLTNLQLVPVLPILSMLIGEIRLFLAQDINRSEGQDLSFSTTSMLLIGFLSVMSTSQILTHFSLRQERPKLILVFLWGKIVSGLLVGTLLFGTRHKVNGVPSIWTYIANTAGSIAHILDVYFSYFYYVRVKEGWRNDLLDASRAKSSSFSLSTIPWKHLSCIQHEPLGHGHTSTVYRCQLEQAKLISCFRAASVPAAMKCFCIQDPGHICQELGILNRIAKLNHPNVVRFYGICAEYETMSVVFELCERGSLKRVLHEFSGEIRVRGSQVLLKQLYNWSLDVAIGMAFLSSNQIIHGDLAARNVLLSPNLVAKISDFGLSHKLYGNRVYQRLDEGTSLPWKWMAPEVLTDFKVVNGSDVWSYGVTLWEIFSLGQDPWQGLAWDSAFCAVLQSGRRMDCPSSHCNNLFYEECLLPCWELDPSNRPTFDGLREYIQRIIRKVFG